MLRKLLILTIVILLTGVSIPLRADHVHDLLRRINDSIADAKAQHDYPRMAGFISGRTSMFYNLGLSDSVINRVPKDLETLKSIEQWERYYESWSYLINTYIYYSKSKNTALREVQAMFDDAMKRNSEYGIGIAYYAMGNVYLNMNNLEQSADAYKKGLDVLSRISPYPMALQEVYSYYGDVLNEQKKYKELENLTVRWAKFLDELMDQIEKSESKLNNDEKNTLQFYYWIACAQASLGLNKLKEAGNQLKEARKYIASEENYEGATWLSTMSLLRFKEGRIDEAYQLNTRRMNLISPDEDKGVFLSVAALQGEILQRQARYEEAARLYKEMYAIKDSISNADTKNQLNEMNTLFKVDEIKMEKERAQFRLMLIIIGIVVLALVIFIVFRTIAARRLKKAHEKLQATHEELQTAYDQLEETTTAKERIESDLRIARNIQMGMVPRTFPDRPDLDLYASMTPAKEVGGDLYGYLLTGDKLYFALGDVSGKGVPASLFMAQATRLFRTLAAQQLMPAEIATQINEALSGEDNETSMFVTMFLGLVDLKTGHLDFCNAGHNPPVLLTDGKSEFVEMIPNAPIGLWPGLPYEGEEIADITERPLFVYTDGLNEAENRQQEQFTDERLLEILENTPFESSQQTVEMLREAVEQHRDGAEPNDDLTMLCVKVRKVTEIENQ